VIDCQNVSGTCGSGDLYLVTSRGWANYRDAALQSRFAGWLRRAESSTLSFSTDPK